MRKQRFIKKTYKNSLIPDLAVQPVKNFSKNMKKAFFATIFFCALYGLQIVTQKIFIKSAIHPLHLNFLTCLTSFILMTIYFAIFDRKMFLVKQTKNNLTFFFLAVFTWVLADLSSIFGLQISSSINFSIISRLQTFITYFLAVLIFKESFKKNKLIAIFISFLGSLIVIISWQTNLKISFGDSLFLIFAFLISVSGLIRQKVTKTMNPFQMTYLMYGLASLLLGIIVFFFKPLTNIDVPLFILFNALLSLSGFSLVNYAIHQGGAAFFSVTASLLPVFTAFFSFLILKQLPSINQIFGGVIIATGIFLFQYHKVNMSKR